MREHEVNRLDNFIMGWYGNPNFCDELINYWKNDNEKYQGTSGDPQANKKIKDSTDSKLDRRSDLGFRYITDYLQPMVDLYTEKYKWCHQNIDRWSVIDYVQIQHYKPGGGFHQWHKERVGLEYPNCARHLVFLTYLNDVTDAGETEFYYQKIKIKPEKGLTLIWPVDWTHTHRGIASPTQEKYIVTGWYNFIPTNPNV